MIEVREVKKAETSEEKINQMSKRKLKDQQITKQKMEENNRLMDKADSEIEKLGGLIC